MIPRMSASPNSDLLARSLSAVWHPCTQMKRHETLPLVPISRGQGVWLFDFDGKCYLDTVSSWWVNLFGHCNPRINTALVDQFYADIQAKGGGRWETSSLITRLAARK